MIRKLNYCFVLFVALLTACSDLSSNDVETLLTDAKAYPHTIEVKLYCNSDYAVREVIEKELVKKGFVTAQLKHTIQDVGEPLVRFTDEAKPYLIPTSDTLKSFDIQRIRVADEVLLRVQQVEINAAGNRATVDYVTEIINHTPFIALYEPDVSGQHKRRTFFTKEGEKWKWDGKIIKMPR